MEVSITLEGDSALIAEFIRKGIEAANRVTASPLDTGLMRDKADFAANSASRGKGGRIYLGLAKAPVSKHSPAARISRAQCRRLPRGHGGSDLHSHST